MVEPYLGEIRVLAGTAMDIPDGWRLCDGATLEISDYANLFAVMGTIYGGDGVNNFCLPNLIGRTAMGYGSGWGLTPRTQWGQSLGEEHVILTEATIPPHTHTLNASANDATSNNPVNTSQTMVLAAVTSSAVTPYGFYTEASGTTAGHAELSFAAISTAGDNAAHPNVMPSMGLYYIIAVDGLFPYAGGPYVPVVTAVEPNSGPPVGNSTDAILAAPSVTIKGLFFDQGGNLSVSFGGVPATITAKSSQSITVTCPPGTGQVVVSVTTGNGSSATTNGSYYRYLPSVTSVSPSGGRLSGGQVIHINGMGFTNATAVTFGTQTVAASLFSVLNDELIEVRTPPMTAGTGVVPVSVSVSSGSDTLTSSPAPGAVFDYGPVLKHVQPAYGAPTGGTVITLTGSNFSNQGTGLGVMFGSRAAPKVTVVSDTELQVTIPSGTGRVPIWVSTAQITTPPSHTISFSYEPVVHSISPEIGSAGTSVTINGDNFYNISTVFFGATGVTPSNTSSTTQLVVTAPVRGGIVPVTVSGSGGVSNSSGYAPSFNYLPVLLSLAPLDGPPVGGNVVALAGQNFTSDAVAMFGSTKVVPQAVTPVLISVQAPAGTANSTVPVTVVTAGGTSDRALTYAYGGPVGISMVEPAHGRSTGGTLVTIWGYGMGPNPTVTFGGVAATSVSVNSSGTMMTCTSPAGVGEVDLVVTVNGNSSSTGVWSRFSYVPYAQLVLPSTVPNTGGKQVTIYGHGYVSGQTQVLFGSVAGTNISVSSELSMTVTAPAGSGLAPITVTTPGGTSVGCSLTYTPSVLTVSPSSGSRSGGQAVLITGPGLATATGVKFGSNKASAFGLAPDKTTLWATAPAGSGTVDVIVTTPTGTTSPNPADRFFYDPLVTGISPLGGAAGQTATITGAGFTGATSVRFGPISVPCTATSDTSITVTVPQPINGFWEVEISVQTPHGSSKPIEDQITYTYAPVIESISPTEGNNWSSITLTGQGLQHITGVYFGSVRAQSGYWKAESRHPFHAAYAWPPYQASAKLLVPITVTSAFGTSPVTPACMFQYTV